MGAHHFKLDLLSRNVAERQKDPESVINEGIALEGEVLPGEMLVMLRRLLPNDTSWGKTEEFESSNKWGSDLRIWHDDDTISSIEFRYSPIADPAEILEGFLSIAKAYNFLVYCRSSKKVLEPELGAVVAELKGTNAALFCSDPEKAIVNAARQVKHG